MFSMNMLGSSVFSLLLSTWFFFSLGLDLGLGLGLVNNWYGTTRIHVARVMCPKNLSLNVRNAPDDMCTGQDRLIPWQCRCSGSCHTCFLTTCSPEKYLFLNVFFLDYLFLLLKTDSDFFLIKSIYKLIFWSCDRLFCHFADDWFKNFWMVKKSAKQ